MTVRGLGKDFDVLHGIAPVLLATGANTGARVHMRNYSGLAIVAYFGVGTAAEPVTINVKQHTAATGGTSSDFDVAGVATTTPITEYYVKSEATLDGDEQWAKVTHDASNTITNADWDDALQGLVVVQVNASDLADGYEWVSADIPDTGSTAGHPGCLLYIGYGLKHQRAPESLVQPNA